MGFPPYPADAEWHLILARRTICALKQELECTTAKERALERQLEVQERQLATVTAEERALERQLAAVTADLRRLTGSVVYTGSNATLKSLTIV